MDRELIKYSCVVDTNYTLSLYLLYMSKGDIDKTAFFVGNAIPEIVTSKLNHVIRLNTKDYNGRLKIIKHHIEALIKWKFRNKTIFFAQDHLLYSSHIIGSNDYTLLEDAPNIFSVYKDIAFMRPRSDKSLLRKLLGWIYYGKIRHNTLGTNSLCKKIIYTSENDIYSDLLKGKQSERVSMKELWDKANFDHQNLIMEVFSLKDKLAIITGKNVILFSQPLMTDCEMTEDEVVNIYKPYIDKYKNEGVVIKPHPRDKFNYRKYFGEVEILETPAPMQLLSAMGVKFNIAITVCSSAISSMSKDTEVIWIGTEINKKIENVYGHVKCPILNS